MARPSANATVTPATAPPLADVTLTEGRWATPVVMFALWVVGDIATTNAGFSATFGDAGVWFVPPQATSVAATATPAISEGCINPLQELVRLVSAKITLL